MDYPENNRNSKGNQEITLKEPICYSKYSVHRKNNSRNIRENGNNAHQLEGSGEEHAKGEARIPI